MDDSSGMYDSSDMEEIREQMAYRPSPEQIRREAARIRASWSPQERARRYNSGRIYSEVATISPKELFGPHYWPELRWA